MEHPSPTALLPDVGTTKPGGRELNLDKILRRLVPFICLGVLGNLAYSFFGTDKTKLAGQIDFSWGWLLAAVAFALLPWGWHCLRLAIWGRFFGVKIAWLELFRIVVATDVGGAVMPNAVGGAPLKLAMLVRQGYRPGQAATLTLWGNIEDTIFYVFVISISLSLTQNWDHPLWQKMAVFLNGNQTTAAIILMSLVLILLIFRRLVKKRPIAAGWLEKLRHAIAESRAAFQHIGSKGRKPFLWSLAALAAQWLTRFCILPAVVLALGFHGVDFSKIFLLQWMVFVAMLLTPTPGATGGAEAAFLLVYAGTMPDGSAAVVMVLWRLLTYYLVLVTGAVILAGTNRRRPIETAPRLHLHPNLKHR